MRKAWKATVTLGVAALFGAAAYLAASAGAPRYESRVEFVPEGYQILVVNMVPKISSGIEGEHDVDPEADAINPALYPKILLSTPVVDSLLARRLPAGPTVSQTLASHGIGLPEQRRYILDNLSLSIVYEKVLCTLSARMPEPEEARQTAAAATEVLQDYITSYRARRRDEKLANIRLEADEASRRWHASLEALAPSDSVRLEQQMAREAYAEALSRLNREAARLAELREPFTIIEPATLPDRPSTPGRIPLTLCAALFGGILTFLAFRFCS